MAAKKAAGQNRAKNNANRRRGGKGRGGGGRRASAPGGAAYAGDISVAADFVGRDKVVNYNYTPAGLDKLIEKLLEFLEAGAVFVPYGARPGGHRAELDGESLTFHPDALRRLTSGRLRSEQTHLINLTVAQRYGRWATEFVPLAAVADLRQEDVDVAPLYELTEPPPPGAGPGAQPNRAELTDITQALDKHLAFVILGAPGAGKTSTLQKITFEQARARLAGRPARVPLPVRLSEQHGKTPHEFLEGEWRQYTGGDFDDALAEGRVLVLADGINEMPRDLDLRAERLKDWRSLVERHGEHNQFVFTSRASGEYGGHLSLPNVLVKPLDEKRIADYARRQKAEGLLPLLADPGRRLADLAANPFYLQMMTQVYRTDPDQLANRGRLIETFIRKLLNRERDQAHRGWAQAAPVMIPALARLAFAWQEKKLSLTIEARAARAMLPETVEVDGEDCAVPAKDLLRLARAATILDPAAPTRSARFYHQLLQEYLAALELLRRREAGEDLARLWQAPRLRDAMPPAEVSEWDALPEPPGTGWEETTVLACGLAADAPALVEAVRAHNPNLAGRCWLEAGIEWAETAQTELKPKLQQDLLAELCDPRTHLRARLQAGYTLGRLDDPRFAPRVINGVKVILPALVQVPGDTYTIGSSDDDDQAHRDEKPQHTVDLTAFAIGKWPVTNAEFACFMGAGGYKDEQWWETQLARRWLRGEDVTGGQLTAILRTWTSLRSNPNWKEAYQQAGIFSPQAIQAWEWLVGLSEEEEVKAAVIRGMSLKSRECPQYWFDTTCSNPSQPVVGITWFEANAYCAWLSAASGRRFRLPTEAEWEAAARGLDGRAYPWGNDWDNARANTIEGRVQKPSPVGAYTAAGNVGPFEGEDQAGNVWNWTSSLYRPYRYQADDGREDPEAEGERCVRGGAWDDRRRVARCACRVRGVPDNFDNFLGFRVLSPGS